MPQSDVFLTNVAHENKEKEIITKVASKSKEKVENKLEQCQQTPFLTTTMPKTTERGSAIKTPNIHKNDTLRTSKIISIKSNSLGRRKSETHKLEISELDEDEIFNLSPEEGLKYNLLINNQEKIPKFKKLMDKRTKMFNSIYQIDEEFLDNLNNIKKKKHLPLLDYQNNLINLISNRMSKENLRKLSTKLNQIREITNKVYKLPYVDWNQFEILIKNVKISSVSQSPKIRDNPVFHKAESTRSRISAFIPDSIQEKFRKI